MDLESFAETHGQMSKDLLDLVADVHANVTITNERLEIFCETLMHYMLGNGLCLKPAPTNDLLNQAIAFSNTFGKGSNDISHFKTKLGEIYVPLVQRLAAVELYLSKELNKDLSLNKRTSTQPT